MITCVVCVVFVGNTLRAMVACLSAVAGNGLAASSSTGRYYVPAWLGMLHHITAHGRAAQHASIRQITRCSCSTQDCGLEGSSHWSCPRVGCHPRVSDVERLHTKAAYYT